MFYMTLANPEETFPNVFMFGNPFGLEKQKSPIVSALFSSLGQNTAHRGKWLMAQFFIVCFCWLFWVLAQPKTWEVQKMVVCSSKWPIEALWLHNHAYNPSIQYFLSCTIGLNMSCDWTFPSQKWGTSENIPHFSKMCALRKRIEG